MRLLFCVYTLTSCNWFLTLDKNINHKILLFYIDGVDLMLKAFD